MTGVLSQKKVRHVEAFKCYYLPLPQKGAKKPHFIFTPEKEVPSVSNMKEGWTELLTMHIAGSLETPG